MTLKPELLRAHNAVCAALGKLADDVFVKGMKLTFVMREPNNEDCYMVVGDDTVDGAIAALERSRNPALVMPPETIQ